MPIKTPRNKSRDWKNNTNILTTQTEEEEAENPVDKQENLQSKETKHQIIKAIEEEGIQKRKDLQQELDQENELILEKIEELKAQGILEVVR